MISWQRLVYYLGLAVVEATPPALLLTLAGGDAWAALIGVTLLGALTDWIVLRRLPAARQPPAQVGVGLLGALWVVKGLVAGDYGLLGDWGQALGAIFSISHPRAGVAYLGLLVALYCFWRGTRLTMHDRVSIHRVFRAAAFGLLLIAMLSLFSTAQTISLRLGASTQVLTFFAVGLVTIALASATEDREAGLRRLGLRGLLILCGAVALVLVLGLLVGAFAGDAVGQIVLAVWGAFVLLLALIFAPLIFLMTRLLEWLVDMSSLRNVLERLAQLAPQGQRDVPPAGELLGAFPAWAQATIRIFFALLPILLVIGLLLLARRRLRRQQDTDEERESLWSWSSLADDLRGLLARRRRPSRDGGLRAALARLRGGDPVSRIRRSYIRLLLAGEARNQPRAARQTPREYAADAGTMLPAAAQPIETLTAAYERARYHPTGATTADADSAEQAWQSIEQAK
jgi:hypothetical protein